jgi:hypothetical protein
MLNDYERCKESSYENKCIFCGEECATIDHYNRAHISAIRKQIPIEVLQKIKAKRCDTCQRLYKDKHDCRGKQRECPICLTLCSYEYLIKAHLPKQHNIRNKDEIKKLLTDDTQYTTECIFCGNGVLGTIHHYNKYHTTVNRKQISEEKLQELHIKRCNLCYRLYTDKHRCDLEMYNCPVCH